MPCVDPYKHKQLIRYGYVVSQWASVFCAFAGSLFSLYDVRNPDGRGKEDVKDYVWNCGAAFIAATISAYIANQFQGKKIGVSISDQADSAGDPPAPQQQSCLPKIKEITFILFASGSLFVDNYFTFACAKAWVTSLVDPNNQVPILPATKEEFLLILIVQTILIDFPFSATNAFYETCEAINKPTPWIAGPVRFFSRGCRHRCLLFWIKSIGVLSHVLGDLLGIILLVPPSWLIRLHEKHKQFWGAMGTIIVVLLLQFFISFLQTLYFEGKESEKNLKKVGAGGEGTPLIPARAQNNANCLSRLFSGRCNRFIRTSFYSQGIFHALGDVMSVVLFLRDIAHRGDWPQRSLLAALIPSAVIVCWCSFWGTHYSEITSAIAEFDEDFPSRRRHQETHEMQQTLVVN